MKVERRYTQEREPGCDCTRRRQIPMPADGGVLVKADEPQDSLALRLGSLLLRLQARCEARGQAWGLYQSHCTLPGREGRFVVIVAHGPERGRTEPFTGAEMADVIERACGD